MLFRLTTFGELALHDCAAQRNRVMQRKALALLAVLAVTGKTGMTRERLLALLWPDSSEESGRGALRQTIYEIRRAAGNGDLVIGTTDLSLDSAVISTDVADFESARVADDWKRLVDLHRGPFLEGLSVRHAAEFERWANARRARYEGMYREGLEQLALQESRLGQMDRAVAWWRVLAAEDPMSARSALGLMNALAASGDRSGALAHYRLYEGLLREELEAEPDPVVAEAAERIKRNGSVQRDAVVTPSAHGSETGQPTVARAHLEPQAVVPQPGLERRGRAWHGFAPLAATIVLALLITAIVRSSRPTNGPLPLAVVAFENMTGDQSLDAVGMMAADRITEGVVRAQLAPVIEPTYRSKPVPAGDAGAGAGVVITGRVYADADSLRLHALVTDVRAGRLLAAFGPLAYSRSRDPLEAVTDVSDRVIGALARVYDRRLRDVMDSLQPPPRAAAYRHYIRGLQLQVRDLQPDSALAEFRAAYALDTSFVTALVWSVWSLRASGRHPEARLTVDTLAGRRSVLSPLHRNAVDAFRAMYAADWDMAIAASARAAAMAPQSEWTWYQAQLLVQGNRPRDALRLLRQIDPSTGWLGESGTRYWDAMAIVQHVLGDFDGELATIRAAPGFPSSHFTFLLGLNLAARDDFGDLLQFVEEQLRSDTVVNVIGIETIVREMAEHNRIGRTGDGRAALDSVVTLYRGWLARRPSRLPDRFRFSHANIMYWAGLLAEAEREFAQLVAARPGDLYFSGSLARVLARRGDSTRARAVLAPFRESPPYLYKHQSESVLVWQAQVEAWLGNRERATSLLAAAFRSGLKHLHIRHGWESAFPTLRGYKPFEELVRPKSGSAWLGGKKLARLLI